MPTTPESYDFRYKPGVRNMAGILGPGTLERLGALLSGVASDLPGLFPKLGKDGVGGGGNLNLGIPKLQRIAEMGLFSPVDQLFLESLLGGQPLDKPGLRDGGGAGGGIYREDSRSRFDNANKSGSADPTASASARVSDDVLAGMSDAEIVQLARGLAPWRRGRLFRYVVDRRGGRNADPAAAPRTTPPQTSDATSVAYIPGGDLGLFPNLDSLLAFLPQATGTPQARSAAGGSSSANTDNQGPVDPNQLPPGAFPTGKLEDIYQAGTGNPKIVPRALSGRPPTRPFDGPFTPAGRQAHIDYLHRLGFRPGGLFPGGGTQTPPIFPNTF